MRYRTSLLIAVIAFVACAKSDYRVERLGEGGTKSLPLKFDSVSGVRDGEIVTAEARFVDGADGIRINLTVHLGPPVKCTSGTYRAVISGQSNEGLLTCESLAFQGGQDVPAIGGVFLLKDNHGIPMYRVNMPSTQIQRRFSR